MQRSVAARSRDSSLRAVEREETEDPVQRVIGVVGVQGGQAQVAGLGIGEGRLHGLPVADLTDQDAVGRLAHGAAQGILPVQCVAADLALVDQRHLVLEQVFDRVFDGQDVTGAVLVAVVDHRRNGRRLARAGGADNQHQAALFHDDFGQYRRQAEAFEARNVAENIANDDRNAVALPEDVDPEVAQVPPAEGEVHLLVLFEALDLLGRHHFVGHTVDHRRIHRLLVDRQGVAVDLDVNRGADCYEDVRSLLLRPSGQRACR